MASSLLAHTSRNVRSDSPTLQINTWCGPTLPTDLAIATRTYHMCLVFFWRGGDGCSRSLVTGDRINFLQVEYTTEGLKQRLERSRGAGKIVQGVLPSVGVRAGTTLEKMCAAGELRIITRRWRRLFFCIFEAGKLEERFLFVTAGTTKSVKMYVVEVLLLLWLLPCHPTVRFDVYDVVVAVVVLT